MGTQWPPALQLQDNSSCVMVGTGDCRSSCRVQDQQTPQAAAALSRLVAGVAATLAGAPGNTTAEVCCVFCVVFCLRVQEAQV